MDEFDFIVVGAGSAGCILAERLSASGRFSVLVVEAGPRDRSPWIRMPMGFGQLFHDARYNWRYSTVEQKALSGRQIYVPRGKVVGGSGAINALVYVRGHRHDFDDWRDAGNPEWGYDDVLPYFRTLENHPLARQDAVHHGADGRIVLTKDPVHPISDHFFAACETLAVPRNPDFNGRDLEGYGIYDINVKDGRRCSSAGTYLAPALKRSNVQLLVDAMVERVVIRPEGPNALAVRIAGEERRFTARREILLCAGAIGTPALLQRSGIGDGNLLRRVGVTPIRHLPAVGQGLQDHINLSFFFEANQPTLNDTLRSPLDLARSMLDFALRGKGVFATTSKAAAFVRSDATLDAPDLQVYFNPLSYVLPDSGYAPVKVEPYSGFMLFMCPARPTSRGSVTIRSPHAADSPDIDPAYMTTDHDRRTAFAGYRFIDRLVNTSAMKQIIKRTIRPAEDFGGDESRFFDYFSRNASSIFHHCGSCPMGPDPEDAVVSADLKVHGVRGLRVIDASIFPNITSGNTNAPAMMVAEKAASLVLADHR